MSFCENLIALFQTLEFLKDLRLFVNIRSMKRDLRSYFVKADNTNKEILSSSQKVSLTIQSSSNITGETQIQYLEQEIKKQVAKPAKPFIQNIHSREQRLMDGKKHV